ncbi:hypothetical protein PMG11_09812 [Penicillium brasilianum]|uniref:Nucleoside phosphorylase domain-containing protein n=1 Tax=Penicillium brasilianum TaxID=104259 RepID=A0A0F7U0T7_PENBI|nr:hypothetical protein PMG11_09812 [Penicillium brasilianum]
MWSRYVLKRRVDKYQQENRVLLEQHRQSLAYREVRTVKIDCSFLPDSRWGVIGKDPASPAWLLYLDVKISQPVGCSLASANVEVIFRSHHPEIPSRTTTTRLGPIITNYFGPQHIDGKVIGTEGSIRDWNASHQHGETYILGPTSSEREHMMLSATREPQWTLRGCSWPLPEDKTGLPRRIEWLVEDAVACGGLRLALVLQHDMNPFSIDVHIDGRLHGEKNKKYRFFRPMEQGNMKNLSRIVTPDSTPDFQLDEIASKLNSEMTTLNIRNYRSATRMVWQHETSVTHHQKLCLEPKSEVNTDGSDTDHQSKHSGYTQGNYTVAWICALPIEMAAAKAMLDEIHPSLCVPPSDTNQYILGRIGSFNIVLACLPERVYGTTSAAVVATHILHTFKRIRIRLMVGIGGGVPSAKNDIRLGDVVVSSPTGPYGGVIQHDLGKHVGHKIQMTGSLGKPSQSLLIAVARLRTEHLLAGDKVSHYVEEMLTKSPMMRTAFACRSSDQDQLFEAGYEHVESSETCTGCDQSRTITRPSRSFGPKIHYGLIASGN